MAGSGIQAGTAPSRPKFLDRLITNSGLSRKYAGDGNGTPRHCHHLISSQDSSRDQSDDEEEGPACRENEKLTRNTDLLQSSNCVDCRAVAEPDHYNVITVLPKPYSPQLVRTDCEINACSPPISPILPGFVKQRCESFQRIHEKRTVWSLSTDCVQGAFNEDRTKSDYSAARQCINHISEKADQLVKNFYSFSRDKNFSKAVMEKGYVRALADQINTGALSTVQMEDTKDGDEENYQVIKNSSTNCKENEQDRTDGTNQENFQQENITNEAEERISCECPKTGSQLHNSKNKTGSMHTQCLLQSDNDNRLSRSQSEKEPSRGMLGYSTPPRRKGSEDLHIASETRFPKQKSPLTKPPVDYTHKPKLGAHKSPQSSRINGEVSARAECTENSVSCRFAARRSSESACQSRSLSPSGKKLPPSPCQMRCESPSCKRLSSPRHSLSDTPAAKHSSLSPRHSLSECNTPPAKNSSPSLYQSCCSTQNEVAQFDSSTKSDHNNSALYDNVFFGRLPLSPQELFDMSWSDTDSEFSDSEVDEGTATEHQVTITDQAHHSLPKDKLHQIAYELLTTERAYVQRLSLLHQVFYFRIDQENRTQGFLPGDTLTRMFSSIQSIHQFHNDFLLKELEERMHNWENERRIGDLMKKNAPFLKLYTAYIKSFDNAMNLINYWLEKSPKFASIVYDIQKMPECGSLSLQHHMLEPVQRVPRYELMLKDYLKHLSDDSPDRQDAQDALDLVTKAASHSNEAMKKIEKFHRLLDIYQRLRGVAVDFICPTRDFLREGPITKISARSGEKQSRYLFLFNDLLLICSDPLMGMYRVRAQLDVEGMEVKQGDNLAIPDTFLVHSKQKAIELLEEQPSGNNETSWLKLLKQVIEDHRSRKGSLRSDLAFNSPTQADIIPGKQAPRWIPDDAATMCMMCQLAFSTFRRRHHCRACGKLICKSCSKKAPLEYMKNKMERVCIGCHDAIVYSGQKAAQLAPAGETSPKKRAVLQVKADDPGLLAGYLQISEDTGKTWNKRWFSLHDDFVMYYFKARQDVSAYTSLPLPGYQVEYLSLPDKPNSFRVYHKSINKKGLLFQADNEKVLKKWVNMLSKLVLAQLPDDSQRLSSQSNSSTTSSGSDSIAISNNNNTSSSNDSNKLSQAESGIATDSQCSDSVQATSCDFSETVTDSGVSEK